MNGNKTKNDKSTRANASQFIVAGELCRRGLVAVVTLGNSPNTDILCSNKEGTKFVHIQVKTFVPGNRTVSVGRKAEKNYGENFVWVLAGIQLPEHSDKPDEFFVIPSSVIAPNVREAHQKWLSEPGRNGPHHDSNVRIVRLPSRSPSIGWSIHEFRNQWDIIEALLK